MVRIVLSGIKVWSCKFMFLLMGEDKEESKLEISLKFRVVFFKNVFSVIVNWCLFKVCFNVGNFLFFLEKLSNLVFVLDIFLMFWKSIELLFSVFCV